MGLLVGGRYRILGTLGVGGMGTVYEAEHEALAKRVALKTLLPEYARDTVLVERFHREARAATAIGNEHIIDVTDLGALPDGEPYLVMERLQGRTLVDLLTAEQPLSIARVAKIARQICSALSAAHAKGIIHRDLKPANVFLITRQGDPDFVKVLDFGISKVREASAEGGLTATGVALGTPAYMSPEQSQGAKHVDARADVWSLGVMLYVMLTGRKPFDADNYSLLIVAILTFDPDPIDRADVPKELEALVMRCLAKEPASRVASMDELSRALAPFETAVASRVLPTRMSPMTPSAAELPTAISSPLRAARANVEAPSAAQPSPRRRSRALWAVAIVVIVVLGLGVAGAIALGAAAAAAVWLSNIPDDVSFDAPEPQRYEAESDDEEYEGTYETEDP